LSGYRAEHVFALTTITTGYTTVGAAWVINTRGGYASLEIDNSGGHDLTDLKIQLQFHRDAAFVDYLVAADYIASPLPDNLFFVSGTPGTTASAGKTYVIVQIPAAYAIQIQAKVSSSTSSLTVRGSFVEVI